MLAPVYTPGATAISLGGHPSALYGDKSSWSGRSFSDVVSVGGVPDVRMSLAAIDSQSGFFVPASCEFVPTPNGSQGILGLGGAGITVGGTDSYIDRSASAGVFPDVFSVQLCATGGRMWLGGYDATSATTAPAYTPLVTASPYYAVTIADLAVGGTSLGFGAADFGATLVDTGTTVMQLPSAVYSALTAVVATNTVFQQNFGDASSFFGGSTCYLPAQGLTKSQLDQALPALALTFPSSSNGTFMVTLPPTDSYLLEQQDTQGHAYYCPGVAQGPPTIVGANALHTLLAVFDREHSQIGFAPEQGCSAIQALARSLRPSAGVQAGPPVSSRPMPPYRHHRRAE
jgi:hypothetical protein